MIDLHGHTTHSDGRLSVPETLHEAVARELGLGVSGGPDDHGKRTTDRRVRLGSQPVPNEVLEALREKAKVPRLA